MNADFFKPSRAEFHALAAQGNLIPVYTEMVADVETPVSAFQKLDGEGEIFLLESAEHIDKGGRYSFVGIKPRVRFECQGRTIRITENGKLLQVEAERDPLAVLQKLMESYQPVALPGQPPFTGGAVGYLAYDMVRFFEPTVTAAKDEGLGLPDALFLITDTLLVFDHKLRRLRLLANAHITGDIDAAYDAACASIQGIRNRLQASVSLPEINIHRTPQITRPRSNTTQAEYEQMVLDGKEYIRAGDVFQFVPSQRFEADYQGDPLTLYRSLRYVNPSPYMFCFKFDGFSVVGSSPEIHVRALNGKVEIRPIAGTRPRGADDAEDNANAADLLADPKERAEHLMLVDLARNDVGRIAEYATVRVTDFMTIERYSHVMHIVSNVEGTLHANRNAYDVMRATFPAGTVSGSPKVRAMQIINDLEKSKRGVYAGAVGYFGYDGNCDSCIALRTVVIKDGKAYVQAGAGVVADSVPTSEYQETVNKAMGMMKAIALANEI